MNILYFCNVHRAIPTELGVLKKVMAQCKVLRKAGHIVYLVCQEDVIEYTLLDKDENILYEFSIANKSRLTRDNFVFSEIERIVKRYSINLVYSRYSNFSYSAHKFYKKLKTQGITCLLEIPTYPMSQRWTSVKQNIKRGNYITALIQTYNSTIGSLGVLFFKNSLDCVVNNNGFNKIWGIDVIPITNGIDVANIPHRDHSYDKTNKKILVVSVANVARWHGYDRFILGLYEYYKKHREIEVYFELAGPGIEVDILKELALKYGVDKYVTFIGPVSGKKLDELYERADIGISILGIHRNNMTTIDCLKSREFCARKLPFITQSAEKHFEGCRFALVFPSNESPIDIEKVVNFYDRIAVDNTILDEMYSFAKERCDWSVAFKNVVEFVKRKEDGVNIC